MTDFFELSYALRIFILSGMFVTVSAAVFFIIHISRYPNRLFVRLLLSVLSVVSVVILIIYTSGMGYFFYSIKLQPFIQRFMAQPVLICCIPVILLFISVVFFIFRELRYRKQTITINSIKESFDNLPSGLCFSNPDGRVLLFNHRMSELCYAITDAELQNANLFWETLSQGKTSNNVKRLSSGDKPEFRLADGTIWSFSRDTVDGDFQITASETTWFHQLSRRLKEKNEGLADMNNRLRKYGENVDELTRSRERLETKERIHNSLGQALLATRHYLNNPDGDTQAVMELWKRNISVLKTGAEYTEDTYTLNTLFQAAHSAGITIDLSGNLPVNNEIRKLFVIAATEALTNAVRHAKAKTLYIAFSSSPDYYSVRFTNDGTRPDGDVSEGGGLENLRRRVERMGGEMRVTAKPRYILEIKIDAKVEDSYVEGSYC